MDAQGHVNNAAYVDYLQEARVDFLLSGSPVLHEMLDTGVVVASHQVEYLRPITAFGAGCWMSISGWTRWVPAGSWSDTSCSTGTRWLPGLGRPWCRSIWPPMRSAG